MDGVTQSPADALRWALEQVQSVCDETEAELSRLSADRVIRVARPELRAIRRALTERFEARIRESEG